MTRPWIVQGDRTSHGGTVIEGDPTVTSDGKPVAMVGHKVTCRKCRGGPFPIVTGAPDFFSEGKAIARHGDKVSCGATLISSQVASTWSSETSPPVILGSKNLAPVAAMAPAASPDTQPEADKYSLRVDAAEVIGAPQGVPYALKRANGSVQEGNLDAYGRTERLYTDTQEKVTLLVGDGEWEVVEGAAYD